MIAHRINRGFDIRIAGKPEATLSNADEPQKVAVLTADFLGIKPKLLVREGGRVRTGDPVFLDKNDRDTLYLSPATGRVSQVLLGERRALRRVEITLEGSEVFADLPAADLHGDRAAIVAAIKQAGLWPLIRQRPVGKIADGSRTPQAIYINGMDSEPLAADPAFACRGMAADLQVGVDLLRALCAGKICLCVRAGEQSSDFSSLNGIEQHSFAGPHPAGLVGTHIANIDPLRSDEIAWYLKAQELALLGQWQRTGQFPTHRVIAVAGTEAPSRGYFRVRNGSSLQALTGGERMEDGQRLINGTVLNGRLAPADGFLGHYAQTLTIMPSGGDQRDLFGWMLPQFGKHSASRSVWSWLMPKKEYDLDARLHGGHRAIVDIGAMQRVMPIDILPSQLIRSIQAGDIEEAMSLGLLEVTEEDMALCTFVDPCKLDVGRVIRQGLDLYETEG